MSSVAAIDRERAGAPCAPQLVECPHCAAGLTFERSPNALIDCCGFESYALTCQQCGTPLAGIIDPSDDMLLLSEAA